MKTTHSINSAQHAPMMSFDIPALRASLDAARDDLHNMAFSEMPLDALVAQSAKIRALKTKITKLENSSRK